MCQTMENIAQTNHFDAVSARRARAFRARARARRRVARQQAAQREVLFENYELAPSGHNVRIFERQMTGNGVVTEEVGTQPVVLENHIGRSQVITLTDYTVANNIQNIPASFVNECLNTQIDNITLRVVSNNQFMDFQCGLYVNTNTYKISHGWRNFCEEMGFVGGNSLILNVIDGQNNIVKVGRA
ncbi:hypothetical protein RIF29_25196 [Crotalaria pallida]|uniref:TF-B3 domain-containing protein n=1 Tax=Crotalaria pallida TaxID=3830 RepID=A0AAN9ELP1_CROPI